MEGYFRRGMCKLYTKNYHAAIEDLNLALKTEEVLSEDPNHQINHDIPDGLG